jgi:flagellar hook-length control protein FliK
VSIAISPSSDPVVKSAPSPTPPSGGSIAGGFAELFESVSGATEPTRPPQVPQREETPSGNNQATPTPRDPPTSQPVSEPPRRLPDQPATSEASAVQPAEATEASDATETGNAAINPESPQSALQQPLTSVTGEEGAKELPAVSQTDELLLASAPMLPLTEHVQGVVGSAPSRPPLSWCILPGGMRVLTTQQTPDPESLATFAQRQGLTLGQWQQLNGLTAEAGSTGRQGSAQGTSQGLTVTTPEVAAALQKMAVTNPAHAPAVTAGATQPVELLVLEVDRAALAELGLADEWRPEAGPRPTIAAPATTGSLPGATAAAGTAATFAAQWYRQGEAYQALARQLGEAMASRMQQQISRGQWQLQLTLRPATLGRVDVDLSMRQGELEATFQASQASTRELLVDSFPRLREALQQSGTQVASLDVQGESRGESDRKPTPQPLAAGPASSDESSPANTAGPLRSTTLDNDAVDVWA